MTFVRERFNPVPMAANSTYVIQGPQMGGFLCKVAGTISIVTKDATGVNDVTIVDAVPVTAGDFVPIPVMFPTTGATVTLAGGAAGTLMV